MLRIMGETLNGKIVEDVPLESVHGDGFKWCWADFSQPEEKDGDLLQHVFGFHPLAVEDCFHLLQRPKLDHYEDSHFFVLHGMDPATREVREIDMFLAGHVMVTVHLEPSQEVEDAWRKLVSMRKVPHAGHIYAAYLLMDKMVDRYFPGVEDMEDQVLAAEDTIGMKRSVDKTMDEIFEIRSELLKLRRTVTPMRDLLYRILNTEKIEGLKQHHAYFSDIHDHLLKLTEMIDSLREMTADLRDSYTAFTSNRMNTIMKTLTVITTIFMPLTFIAGIYGMNFAHMPELGWKWGYYTVLGGMFLIGAAMYLWFKRKGWFD
ncbi:magnesium/cobalt transporter CorA [Gorillibacterium sp. sgz5001074]|uniref:magnesium/cobalt transporter CorA n=1 Tax=Gorillibacterium sp. sgz5001074 TaxID=3446695 RepID=UPI003F6638DA